MMATTSMIYDYIDSFAPYKTQMQYDNSGLMIGSGDREITKALVCLDAGMQEARKAIELGCGMIIAHHPIIFNPLRRIDAGSAVYELIKNEVDVISAHTNLDIAPGGVNDCLARAIGLVNTSFIEELGLGVRGELEAAETSYQFAMRVKELLGCEGLYFTEGDRPVKSVAVIGGAGADEASGLLTSVDAVVTGESKHHVLLLAKECGCTFVTAGHFETERVVVKPLSDMLAQRFPEVEFLPFEAKCPVRYI